MSFPKVAKLVCFGRGGDSVEYGGGCHGSGYGTPEKPHAAAPDKDLIIPDGTPAIDKRAAVETEAGYKWVFNGPMCNPDLADDECDALPQVDPMFATAMAGNEFGTLLDCHAVSRAAGKKRSGLDFVSVREYVDGWRDHGARIGYYKDGVIIWES